jgi:tetraacyldisaccharide 4'-kinase
MAGVPIIVGPHMQNFEAITRDFLNRDAVLQIQVEEQLLPLTRELLRNRSRGQEIGLRARRVVESQQGASRRIATALTRLYHKGGYRTPRGLLARSTLSGLAFLWEKGGAVKRCRSLRYAALQRRLPVSIVSVGGITVGGSGKTPFVNYLARQLSGRGYSPAILTRGYRRRCPAENLVFAPGTNVPPAVTGDEAQIFLRAGLAPIGVGADRYRTAKILLADFPETDVLLLDDGFQHARMDRDLDIVLIDGLDPFGQNAIVPAGRLREPLSALARAGAFVITRAAEDARYEAICARLREYNDVAPIFRTRLIARQWRDYRTGICHPDLMASRVAAFCGLGNPQNFWNTLEALGLEVVFRWAFADHHTYKPYEIQRLAHQARAHGAEILVTTEKDRINCPHHLEKAIGTLDLAWLEIELEIEGEDAFFAFVEQTLRRRRSREQSIAG